MTSHCDSLRIEFTSVGTPDFRMAAIQQPGINFADARVRHYWVNIAQKPSAHAAEIFVVDGDDGVILEVVA